MRSAARVLEWDRGEGALRYGLLAAVGLAALLLAPPALAQEAVEGTWELSGHERSDGEERVQIRLRRDGPRGDRSSSFSVPVDELHGLSPAVLRSDVPDARFELEREAGTVTFTGELRRGEGTGFFRFLPDPAYRARMAGLGYPDLSTERVFQFAIFDVDTGFVRELRSLGYEELEEGDLVRFVIHAVSVDFIRAMGELGYADIGADDLVRLRIHGVTPAYVRGVRAALEGP